MRLCTEAKRGCGYRQPGGLYLTSDGVGQDCDLLPVPMQVCPTCGGGIKPARGWTWVSPDGLLPHHTAKRSTDPGFVPPHDACPLNAPGLLSDRAGLLWIGEAYYPTPADWLAEGERMGFSRRVPAVPKGYVPGETWVLCGHRKALVDGVVCVAPDEYAGTKATTMDEAVDMAGPWPVDEAVWADNYVPAIFHLWRPDRLEYVVAGDESDDALAAMVDRGIEPVQVMHLADADTLPGTA